MSKTKRTTLTLAMILSLFACEQVTSNAVSSSSSSPTSAGGAAQSACYENDVVVADAGSDASCLNDAGVALAADPVLTPGKLCSDKDLDFDGYRYPGKFAVCRSHVTQKMKDEVTRLYGVRPEEQVKFEFDHLVPLSIGGANDVSNLWPQPIVDAPVKDAFEDDLAKDVRSGRVTVDLAVAVAKSWRAPRCK